MELTRQLFWFLKLFVRRSPTVVPAETVTFSVRGVTRRLVACLAANSSVSETRTVIVSAFGTRLKYALRTALNACDWSATSSVPMVVVNVPWSFAVFSASARAET